MCVCVCVCVFIWGLHGKHCVVQLIRMYKSLDVVPVWEGRGAVLNVGQLVVSEGGGGCSWPLLIRRLQDQPAVELGAPRRSPWLVVLL